MHEEFEFDNDQKPKAKENKNPNVSRTNNKEINDEEDHDMIDKRKVSNLSPAS